MLLRGIKRLGEPLAKVICAYRGGTAWKLLLEMKQILDAFPTKGRPEGFPPRKKPDGAGLRVLEKYETPPPDAVLLQEVEGRVPAKFIPTISMFDGVKVIEIPLSSPAVKPKRRHCTAGMIYSVVSRGSCWRDRSGRVHETPF